VYVNSFDFISEDEAWYKKIVNKITPEEVPRKARISFTSFVFEGDTGMLIQKQERVIEITFFYNDIKRDKDDEFADLNFKVLSYRYVSL